MFNLETLFSAQTLIVAVICLVVGYVVKTARAAKPFTAKADALRALHAEAVLVSKMPGAEDTMAAAAVQLANEQLAAQHAATAMAALYAPKVPANVPPTSPPSGQSS